MHENVQKTKKAATHLRSKHQQLKVIRTQHNLHGEEEANLGKFSAFMLILC